MPEAPPPGPLPKTIFFRVPVRGGFLRGGGVHERRETTETANVPPRRQVAAAQSAAVTTTKPIGDMPPHRRNQLRRTAQLKRQLLFGRGGLGERRFSQRSGLSPRVPPCQQVAAALSAAVTTTNSQGTAPTSQAEPIPKNRATQTPAALRERGSGGEALLSEKRPLPQNLPLNISLPLECRGWRGR